MAALAYLLSGAMIFAWGQGQLPHSQQSCQNRCGSTARSCLYQCYTQALTERCQERRGIVDLQTEIQTNYDEATYNRLARFLQNRQSQTTASLPQQNSAPCRRPNRTPTASVAYSSLYDPAPQSPAFSHVQTFYNGDQSLTFLAVQHMRGASPQSTANTVFNLERLLTEHRPAAIIVEGMPHAQGPNPCFDAVSFLLRDRHYLAQNFGENILAARLALEQGAVFWGGEPSEQDILSEIPRTRSHSVSQHRFTPTDYRFFRLFQQMLSLIQVPPGARLAPASAVAALEAMRQDSSSAWLFQNQSANQVFQELSQWFRRLQGVSLTAISFESLPHLTAPVAAPWQHRLAPLQQISRAVTEIRDAYLRRYIQEAMNRYGNVAVVYGTHHFYTNRPIFERIYTPQPGSGCSVMVRAVNESTDATAPTASAR